MELKKQLIISIGREYGSGGHRIAEELAKRFGLTFYDYHMLGEIALDKKVDVKTLEKFDELPKTPFFSRTVKGYSNSPQENIANLQFDFLRKKADEGESFVIVGRCAETILKENPNLISFFVLGDMQELLARHDRKRKTYHNHYCKIKWGDSRGYDVSINSSRLGLDGTADIMEEYIKMRLSL